MPQLPGTTSDVDLAPQQLLPQIDRLNDLIYNQVEDHHQLFPPSVLIGNDMPSIDLCMHILQLVTTCRLAAKHVDPGRPQINNGVYKSGFATTQVGYDRAQQGLYAALDEVEAHLQRSRFLLGDRWAAGPASCQGFAEILSHTPHSTV